MNTNGKITLDQIGGYLDKLRAITYLKMKEKGDLEKSRPKSDVLQSVLRGAIKAEQEWEDSRHLFSWFRQAIAHKLADYADKRNAIKRPRIDRDKCLEDLEIAGPKGEALDLPYRFEEALEELNQKHPKSAAVIRARFWDRNEPTWEQVAHTLNLTPDQARYHVTRAIEFLRKKIGKNK